MDGFGQSAPTSKTFEQLGRDIAEGRRSEKGEYGLISMLRELSRTEGMMTGSVEGNGTILGFRGSISAP